MWIIRRTIDLARPDRVPARAEPIPLMYPGDNEGHTIELTVLQDGAAAALSGAPYGYFTRADGQTVILPGTLTGNVLSVTLSRDCYAIRGALRAVLRLGNSTQTETDPCASLLELTFHVRDGFGETYVGPDVFPTLETLSERVDTLEDLGLTSDGTTLISAQALQAANGLIVPGGRSAVTDGTAAIIGPKYIAGGVIPETSVQSGALFAPTGIPMTITEAGFYLISGTFHFPPNNSGERLVSIWRVHNDTTTYPAIQRVPPSTASYQMVLNACGIEYYEAGDTLGVGCTHTRGSAMNVSGYFYILRL